MELEVNLQFVKFGPHPSSNSIYDINNGETNKIVVRQFKGEHEPNEECHFLIPTLESDRIDGNWKTVAKQSPGHLYGPASLKNTRQVVYPCGRSMCWVVCPCEMCDRTNRTLGRKQIIFSNENNLRDHAKKHHLLKCEICGLSFSRNSALRTHRLGGGDLPCDDCDKVFCNQKQLRLHEKIHQKTTIVECEYCKQTFSKVWMLLRHKKSEAVCQKCNQKFCAKAEKCHKCHQN